MIRIALICATATIALSAQAQPVTIVLEPAQEAELKTTVNGRLSDVLVVLGQSVSKGEELARIDAQVQTARLELARVVAEAKGGQVRAEKIIEQAASRLDLMRKARERGAAQVWEVEAAEQALAIANADLLLAQEDQIRKAAEMTLQVATLDEFSLRSPFGGTILDVLAEEGEVVETETTVVVVGNLATLEGTAFFPVDWIAGLDLGATLPANTDSGERVSARVAAIDPRIDPASTTVRVVLEVDNEGGGIRAGTRLSIERP